MFIAMNNFKVAAGKGRGVRGDLARTATTMHEVPGVVRFALLRGDAAGEYISHSTWESRDAFMAWTQSPAFAAGTAGGSLMGIIEGPPQAKLYDAVLEQEFAAAQA